MEKQYNDVEKGFVDFYKYDQSLDIPKQKVDWYNIVEQKDLVSYGEMHSKISKIPETPMDIPNPSVLLRSYHLLDYQVYEITGEHFTPIEGSFIRRSVPYGWLPVLDNGIIIWYKKDDNIDTYGNVYRDVMKDTYKDTKKDAYGDENV